MADVPRSAIQRFDHIQPVNNGSQALLQTGAFLAGPKSSEIKNWFTDARLAQLETFFRYGHAKPIDAFSFQTPSAGNRAMTVRVRLHGGHHANFAANLSANRTQVVRESIEIDLTMVLEALRRVKVSDVKIHADRATVRLTTGSRTTFTELQKEEGQWRVASAPGGH